MTDRQVRYVRSPDGTRIAYSTIGQGRPVVWIVSPMSMSTISIEDRVQRVKRAISRMSEGHQLVRIDPRGRGLSDRLVSDRSLDAYVADVMSVVNLLPQPVDLVAEGNPAIGIACAARSPSQVRKLVLTSLSPWGEQTPRREVFRQLAGVDFDLFKRLLILMTFDWDDGKGMESELKDLTSEEWTLAARSFSQLDPLAEAPGVSSPTLVVHSTNSPSGFDPARTVAAAIAGAELRLVETESVTSFDARGLTPDAIIEFLDRDDGPSTKTPIPSGTAIVLFADIVDSTAITEQLGDAAFRDKSRELDSALRAIINECGGSVIDAKTLGDGVLATFPAASQAIDAALRFEAAAEAAQLQLHVGLHAGDVIREDGNVFGGAVNIAARISALSAAGEVLVSATVRDLARTSAGVTFEDRGEQPLKGVTEPVRVFAVRREGT